MNYLAFYILVKNVLEMYPGGLKAASSHFDDAWEWASHYDFSSFKDHIFEMPTPIINDPDNLLSDFIEKGNLSKQEMKEILSLHMLSRGEEFKEVALESW